jgi:hypothetical protein
MNNYSDYNLRCIRGGGTLVALWLRCYCWLLDKQGMLEPALSAFIHTTAFELKHLEYYSLLAENISSKFVL